MDRILLYESGDISSNLIAHIIKGSDGLMDKACDF